MANERRLIDASRFENSIQLSVESWCRDCNSNAPVIVRTYKDVLSRIRNTPTVDAVEVVHGRWVPLEADGYADESPVWDLWECSNCREEHSGDEDTLTPYCPYCGAKMEEGG